MKRTHLIAAGIVWPLATALGVGLLLWTGPVIEGRLAPVLANQTVDRIERAGDKVCWRWNYEKLRNATPETFAWAFFVRDAAIRVPAVVARAGERTPLTAFRARPVGPGHIDLCATIPDDLADIADVKISGAVEYETNHNLWTIWQQMPAVAVPKKTDDLP